MCNLPQEQKNLSWPPFEFSISLPENFKNVYLNTIQT